MPLMPAGRLVLGGAAVICCVHGAEKYQVTDIVFDRAREQVSECPCCRSLYATEIGDPIPTCHACRPRSTA